MEMVSTSKICCCSCQVLFWITESHYEQLKNSHKTFYCPNGHTQLFSGNNELEKYKELYVKMEKQNIGNIDTIRHQQAVINSYKGMVTKLKKNKGIIKMNKKK
jgi:hypothetical protein